MKCLLALFLATFLTHSSWSALTISGIKCGSKFCNQEEYCSDFDRLCKPCSTICNNKTHNFEPTVCIRDCQDYLHDIRYVRKDEQDSIGREDLRAVVQKLHYMVTVTLTLTCLILIALFAVLIIQICRWKKKNNITLASLKNKFFSKKSDNNANKTGSALNQNNEKPDLRLDMSKTGDTVSENNTPVTMTTSISRRPAEDSALDYAYDNHAMSTTPSPNSKPHESSF